MRDERTSGKTVPKINDLFQFALKTYGNYDINWEEINNRNKDAVLELIDFYKKWRFSQESPLFRDDFTEPDFKILYENNMFVFVGIQTFEGMEFAKSEYCGMVKSNWEIGDQRSLWEFSSGEKYVLAYNKYYDGSAALKKVLIKLEPDRSGNITAKAITQNKFNFDGDVFSKSRIVQLFHISNELLEDWYNTIDMKIES